jgi:hypothetical protein
MESKKAVIRAGVTGQVEQFALQVGDIVNPNFRSGGVLIPEGAGRRALIAGFGQIEAQVMRVGMVAEVTCVSTPWTVIPMVVTGVQDYIAAGQFRGGEQLIDAQTVTRPGTILTILEPLYEDGLERVTPGSSCIANAYTSNHELLASKDVSVVRRVSLHAVDAVGIVHAMLLRIQALLLPVKTLVFSGHCDLRKLCYLVERPLLAESGHARPPAACPLFGVKRTAPKKASVQHQQTEAGARDRRERSSRTAAMSKAQVAS